MNVNTFEKTYFVTYYNIANAGSESSKSRLVRHTRLVNSDKNCHII